MLNSSNITYKSLSCQAKSIISRVLPARKIATVSSPLNKPSHALVLIATAKSHLEKIFILRSCRLKTPLEPFSRDTLRKWSSSLLASKVWQQPAPSLSWKLSIPSSKSKHWHYLRRNPERDHHCPSHCSQCQISKWKCHQNDGPVLVCFHSERPGPQPIYHHEPAVFPTEWSIIL